MPATFWFATLVSAVTTADERVAVLRPFAPTAAASTWHASYDTAEPLAHGFLYLPCARPDDVISVDGETVAAEASGSAFFALPESSWAAGTHDVLVAMRTARSIRTTGYALDCPAKLWLAPIWAEPETGFTASNFAIAGGIATSGAILPRVTINPPLANAPAAVLGRAGFTFATGDAVACDRELAARQVWGSWPQRFASFEDPRIPECSIKVTLQTPIAPGESELASLPVLFGRVQMVPKSKHAITTTITFKWVPEVHAPLQVEAAGPYTLLHDGETAIGLSGSRVVRVEGGFPALRAEIEVQRQKGQLELPGLDFVVVHRDAHAAYAAHYPSFTEIIAVEKTRQKVLREGVRQLRDQGPKVGYAFPGPDPGAAEQADERLRCYAAVPLAQTKILPDGSVVLANGAGSGSDEFWMTWPHLLWFPQLEQQMIDRALARQRVDGLIDDIETTVFWVLRVERSWHWQRDEEALQRWLPALARALAAMAQPEPVGPSLPRSPALLFPHLAALERTAALLASRGSQAEAQALMRRHRELSARVHAKVSEGGLYDGEVYVAVGAAGKPEAAREQDQAMGLLFHQVPADRIATVIAALDRARTPAGIPELLDATSAVSPFANFLDAWARFDLGRAAEAVQLLQDVATADLDASADRRPHARIGANASAIDQASDPRCATYLAAVYFGLLGVDRLSADTVRIAPHVFAASGYNGHFPVPEGTLRMAISASESSLDITMSGQLDSTLAVEVWCPAAAGTAASVERFGKSFTVLRYALDAASKVPHKQSVPKG